MAILKEHIPICREIFKIEGFFSEPFLMFGYQDISGFDLPQDFNYKDVKQLLTARGIKDVKSIDLFDGRAELKYDMNLPVPGSEYERYSVFLDLGSLEHVFDTKQCIENCMKMVNVNGLYILSTVVNGYYNHGLHVFNPNTLIDAFSLNGYEIVYKKYSTSFGDAVIDPSLGGDILIWIVAKKTKHIDKFAIPQQKFYDTYYEGISKGEEHKYRSFSSKLKNSFKYAVYLMLGAEGVQAVGLLGKVLFRSFHRKR